MIDEDIIKRGQELMHTSYFNNEFDFSNLPINTMWAEDQFEIIKQQIQDFEGSLDTKKRVALYFTNFGQTMLMQVNQITYKSPVLIIFKGLVNGAEATLIQHINQINFLLTSVEINSDEPKRKIGFSL